MRCSLIAVLALSVAGSTASAQGIPVKVPPVKMTQEEANVATLTRLEELWSMAIMRRDRAAFERTLAQKFITVQNEVLTQRPEFILALMSPPDMILDARTDSVEVHVFANTAVVTGWRTFAGRVGPNGFERRIRFSDVWMPRSGSWQMISATDYVVPTPVRK